MTSPPDRPRRRTRYGYRIAAILIGILAIGVVIAFPIALAGMISEVINPTETREYEISAAQRIDGVDGILRVDLDVVGIEEVQGTVRIRVTAQVICRQAECDWKDEVIFAANETDSFLDDSLPPFEIVAVTPERPVSTVITLPIQGDPVQYPFDRYRLELGFVMQRSYKDGRQVVYGPAESAGRLIVTVEDTMARFLMEAPVVVPPEEVEARYEVNYSDVAFLTFYRPIYTQALAVVLIALIASASVYAVFLRPLHDLLLGVGAIVLGVWGVRNILVPGQTFISVVDFALSTVILFVLGAVSVRAMIYFWQQSRPVADDGAEQAPDGP